MTGIMYLIQGVHTVSHELGHDTVLPLVGLQVELAVQFPCGDGLGVEDEAVDDLVEPVAVHHFVFVEGGQGFREDLEEVKEKDKVWMRQGKRQGTRQGRRTRYW